MDTISQSASARKINAYRHCSPSYKEVMTTFYYDPITGFLYRKNGTRAGTLYKSQGYRRVKFNGIRYQETSIIWLIVTGKWPENEIDHRNGIRDQNWWDNLREATSAQQGQNKKVYSSNRCGLMGASYRSIDGKWKSAITVNGIRKHLGLFNTPQEAHAAYVEAKREYHKFQPEQR